jgi:hypothetical protein
VIHLFLSITWYYPGYSRRQSEHISTIQSSEYIAIQREHDHHHITRLAIRVSITIVGDMTDLRIRKSGYIVVRCFESVSVEPEARREIHEIEGLGIQKFYSRHHSNELRYTDECRIMMVS